MALMKKNQAELRKKLLNNLPVYAETFLQIRTKSGAISPFILNKAQAIIHRAIEQQKREVGMVRIMILKGRQQGCSTYISGRFYHKTTNVPGQRTFIMTHEAAASANLFDIVVRFHSNMSPGLKPFTSASNAKELLFDGIDSGYKVGTAGTKGTGRSSTIQLFHGSEVAFWPHADSHSSGVLQGIAKEPGTEIILESTANGMGNYFHKTWEAAIRNESDYRAVFVPWYIQSEYKKQVPADFEPDNEEIEYMQLYNLSLEQIAWRREKIIELADPLLFKQEYPATAAEAFQTTGVESYIKNADVIRARNQKDHRSYGAIVAGFDPARDGDDRDAFIYRQANNAWGLEYRGFNTFSEKVAYCRRKLSALPRIDKLFIDYGGSGWEIAGVLREQGFGERIKVINFGSGADNSGAYANKRAEMYGEMKKWFEDKHEPPSIPDDDVLHADLVAPSYSHDLKSRIKLERKSEIKKRFLKSPDGADALALTFAEPVFAEHVHAGHSQLEMSKGAGNDYKPYG